MSDQYRARVNFFFLGPRYSDARRSPDLVLGRSGRRMHKVGVAIDARHATLLQRCVRGATILTFRTYRVGVMTAAAGDTVPPAHPGLSLLRQLHSVSGPNLRIFEIVREFGKNVASARCRLDVGLHEPVCFWDVAVTAARYHPFAVAPMRRAFEIGIVSLNSHRVTGRAERIV